MSSAKVCIHLMYVHISFFCDLLMIHITLLQDGVHHIKVHCRDMNVHINVNSHQLRVLRLPEVDLQMAPNSNT